MRKVVLKTDIRINPTLTAGRCIKGGKSNRQAEVSWKFPTGFGSLWTTYIYIPNLPISSPLLTAALSTYVKFVRNRIPDPFLTPPMQLHLHSV